MVWTKILRQPIYRLDTCPDLQARRLRSVEYWAIERVDTGEQIAWRRTGREARQRIELEVMVRSLAHEDRCAALSLRRD